MDKNKADRVYLGISELGRDNTESGVKSIQGFLSGTQEQENHIFFLVFSMRLNLRVRLFLSPLQEKEFRCGVNFKSSLKQIFQRQPRSFF